MQKLPYKIFMYRVKGMHKDSNQTYTSESFMMCFTLPDIITLTTILIFTSNPEDIR